METDPKQVTVSQGEVDLMFWQYCMGVLQTINAIRDVLPTPLTTIDLLNALAETRHFHFEQAFKIAPSFNVVFQIRNGGDFTIKKEPVK